MRALFPFALLLASCASPASTPAGRPTATSATAREAMPPDTTCPANVAALFATIPFGTLALEGVNAPVWAGIAGTEHLAACLAVDVEGHRVQLLASHVADDEALSSQVLIAIFDGTTFKGAHVVRGPEGEPLFPDNGCADDLGMGNAPAIRVLALEPSPGLARTLVRVEILRDVCGVACGTLSADVVLFALTQRTLTPAFSCRVRDEPYIVSNEQAEMYDCDDAPRDQTLRVVDGALTRCTTDDAPTCTRYTWDGARFTGPGAPESVCVD